MSQAEFRAATPYAAFGSTVSDASADVRRTFIRKTYTHLAAAVYAFAALEWLLVSLGWDMKFLALIAGNRFLWLLVLGAFMAVGWIADNWARSATSIGKQYAGLFLYVAAQAVLFLPMIAIAKKATIDVNGVQLNVIGAAGVTTLIMFAGLTAVAFLTRKDFSFLGGFLGMAMIGAMALIVASILFGFNLGIWFSVLMVVAASMYVLYYTSNILHEYRTDQYVAAALALFASLALLFWYVLRIFLALSSRR